MSKRNIAFKTRNKDRLATYNKQHNDCFCGSHYTKMHEARHKRTPRHINSIPLYDWLISFFVSP